MAFNKKTWKSNAETPFNTASLNDMENRIELEFNAVASPDLYPGRELTEFTWAQLQAKARSGDFSNLRVGDYKTITVGGNTVKMQIAGMDTYFRTTDASGQGLGHHIDFISKDCLPGTQKYNSTNNNNGTADEPNPFLASELHEYLEGTVYPSLPSDVQAVITNKRFLCESRYSAEGALTESTAWSWKDLGKLWLPSEYEVFGSCIWSDKTWGSGQAVQYPIFANSWKNRIKGNGNGGSRTHWWLLSAVSGYSTRFCVVYYGGGAGLYPASDSYCVPLCFRVS